MNGASPAKIAGAEVRVGGMPLDAKLADRLVEVRVDDNLMLPDAFLIRLADPGLEAIDSHPLVVGADVEILLAGLDASSLTSMLTGQVLAVEPEFAANGAIIAARGYDHSHKLNRTRKTQTFQNMTPGEIARKVAHAAGFEPGTVESAGPPGDFEQQNNETYWEFLWRLAQRIDFEVLVTERKLHFRRAGGGDDGSPPVPLRWGENLLTFRPRMTGVQQIDEVVVRGWDPATSRTIESRARATDLGSRIGVARDDVVGALGGGTVTVADRPVLTSEEADGLAKSLMSHLGNAYVEAEGATKGDARLRAGTKVHVERIGTRFGGEYTLSATSHVFRGAKGYRTLFKISGRSPRHLIDLLTPASRRQWGHSVVVGVVTQNQDPDGLGRVRVKYPALGYDTEGWWARIASAGSGDGRGLLMTPRVGDEVLLAFEHGDMRRPYVIGSLWNSDGKPADLVQGDGSFALKSDERIAITAKGNIAIHGDKDLTIDSAGKTAAMAGGQASLEARSITLKSNSSLKIEASAEVSIEAPSVSIKASDTVRVSGKQILLG